MNHFLQTFLCIKHIFRQVITDNHAVSPVADFEISAHDKPFGARITTIDWHPRRQNFFCASSKHGYVIRKMVFNLMAKSCLSDLFLYCEKKKHFSISALQFFLQRRPNFLIIRVL